MANALVFAIATGIGLLTDKYMLEATNFVEHYAVEMRPTHEQAEFIKSSMYAGAILGMVTMGPISDFLGRRACLIGCSFITLFGAGLSTFAWSVNALIAARIITGTGMGGEYPLASSHSAESAKNTGDGARNVALLYLFGSGGGPVLCDLVTYVLDKSGMEDGLIWRTIFAVGTLLSLLGLFLRIMTMEDSKKFVKAAKKEKGTRRKFLMSYWRPLLGTGVIWFLFDAVEYGLKQNDAAIFAADADAPYSESVLMVFFTRLLVIPSLAVAPMLLNKFASKRVQMEGFIGCFVVNLILALAYQSLKAQRVLFGALYIVQLSMQSLPGVTTMAIPAEIYPSVVRGTGAAICAAAGKFGATFGSYYFTLLKEEGRINEIFWTVTCTASTAFLLTACLTPYYDGETIDEAETLAIEGRTKEAVRMLYSGPKGARDKYDTAESDSASEFSGDEVSPAAE